MNIVTLGLCVQGVHIGRVRFVIFQQSPGLALDYWFTYRAAVIGVSDEVRLDKRLSFGLSKVLQSSKAVQGCSSHPQLLCIIDSKFKRQV